MINSIRVIDTAAAMISAAVQNIVFGVKSFGLKTAVDALDIAVETIEDTLTLTLTNKGKRKFRIAQIDSRDSGGSRIFVLPIKFSDSTQDNIEGIVLNEPESTILPGGSIQVELDANRLISLGSQSLVVLDLNATQFSVPWQPAT